MTEKQKKDNGAMSDEALRQLEEARAAGKKIGLVQGSWDMFHLGHLCYLQEARKTCDFLIVAMDDDEKIRYRKGNNRPIIPLEERYQTISRLGIADLLVVKHLGEPHWGLIKIVRPDVLVAIKENYSDEDVAKLEKICGRVAILPRQATTSTSDIIRRTLIKNGIRAAGKKDPRVAGAVERLKERLGAHDQMPTPLLELLERMKSSTDWITPTAACCFWNGRWYFGVNQIDQSLGKGDIDQRSELFYSTVEHAEINLLKKLESVEKLDTTVYTVLFPCDKCMKVLAAKGVKEIRYLEDHLERNWSKRSHELARKKGIKLIQIDVNGATVMAENEPLTAGAGQSDGRVAGADSRAGADSGTGVNSAADGVKGAMTRRAATGCTHDWAQYKFTDPRNAREQKQLDIMIQEEAEGRDPFDPAEIDQEILFATEHWYVTQNRFPYDEIEHQFLAIARGPVYQFDEMSTEMWAELKVIWDRLRREYELAGGALCFRFGDTLLSGASVKRLHAHLIVPKRGNKTKFTIGGRPDLKDGLKISAK